MSFTVRENRYGLGVLPLSTQISEETRRALAAAIRLPGTSTPDAGITSHGAFEPGPPAQEEVPMWLWAVAAVSIVGVGVVVVRRMRKKV